MLLEEIVFSKVIIRNIFISKYFSNAAWCKNILENYKNNFSSIFFIKGFIFIKYTHSTNRESNYQKQKKNLVCSLHQRTRIWKLGSSKYECKLKLLWKSTSTQESLLIWAQSLKLKRELVVNGIGLGPWGSPASY